MSTSKSIVLSVLATFLVAVVPGLAAAAAKPNILCIVSDDTG